MPIVTLCSDFGSRDPSVAVLKGAIWQRNATLQLVDISHNVENYNIVQAAFILKNAYTAFPAGTIHVVSVKNYHPDSNSFLAVRYEGHYFIGPDNGIFSLLFETLPEDIYELNFESHIKVKLSALYADAVGHIANDLPFNEIGLPVEEIVRKISLQAVTSKDHIRGSVIYIDNYDNVVVNITKDVFEKNRAGRAFSIYFKRHNPITKMSPVYSEVSVGETLCHFNGAGYLEIAINMGKAASLLGLHIDETIQIDFH